MALIGIDKPLIEGRDFYGTTGSSAGTPGDSATGGTGAGINPGWPIAAVFDGLGEPNVDLAQDVTLAPNVQSDWRSVLLLALIVGGAFLLLSKKGR